MASCKTFVDSQEMGITGSSYGGYLTCLALTKGADYWTHGFAGSSVTDYRLYDNIYTERYMDTPQDNPEGYKDGSALTYAKDLKGKLYLIMEIWMIMFICRIQFILSQNCRMKVKHSSSCFIRMDVMDGEEQKTSQYK